MLLLDDFGPFCVIKIKFVPGLGISLKKSFSFATAVGSIKVDTSHTSLIPSITPAVALHSYVLGRLWVN